MNMQEAIATLSDKLTQWAEQFVLLLPNLAVAVLLLGLFYILARLARAAARRVLPKVSSNEQINALLASCAYLALLVTGVFVALGVLKLDKTVTSLLAGVGILGLALSFAFKDLASNFMAGILMSFRRPFRPRDIIESNGHMGVVKQIDLRSTVIETFQGQQVLIPNADIFGSPIVNYTRDRSRRVDIPVGVAYGDDLEKAKRVAIEAVQEVAGRDAQRDVELYYSEFGSSSINFELRFWIDFARQTDYLAARSEAIMRIKAAFDANDITIPFPIRTLDFGVVGGQRLSEALPPHLLSRSHADGK